MIYIKRAYPVLVSIGDPSQPYKKRLVNAFRFIDAHGDEYQVEENFITDIASVPRKAIKLSIMALNTLSLISFVLGFIIPGAIFYFFGMFLLTALFYADRSLTDEGAFVVHDWRYMNKKSFRNHVTRKFVDQEMKTLMLQYGASKQRAFFVYYGVRLGGWWYWYDFDKKFKSRLNFK